MRYHDRIKYIKKHAKGDLILTQAGNFYIAIGGDAIFLSKLLGLKCTCFAKETCKVGFPINSLDKYIQKLIKSGYSFVIYNVNNKGEFSLNKINLTNKKCNENGSNLGCENCVKNKKINKKEEENLKSIVIDLEKYKEKIKNETGE